MKKNKDNMTLNEKYELYLKRLEEIDKYPDDVSDMDIIEFFEYLNKIRNNE